MNIDDFILALEKEFDDIPKGTLKPELNYRDIPNFSSMHALIIIAFTDSMYDVILTGADLKQASTVRDLYDIILKKKA